MVQRRLDFREFDVSPGSQKHKHTKRGIDSGLQVTVVYHVWAGSLGAAVAIKELIAAGKLKGTIRFYAVLPKKILRKAYMARAGDYLTI
jgi:aminobenzoyl-glutamate utilization protein B